MKIKDVGELGLIRRVSRRMTRYDNSVIHGIGDDAAVIRWKKDKYLLFASDMIIEGVHFDLRAASPFQIGYKALARNISDIAAMGGVPRYAVVSLAIPKNREIPYFDGIFKGIKSASRKFGINIVGGDMSCSDKIFIDIAIIGEVSKRRLTPRSGAKTGDMIFVTGYIGGSGRGKHLNFTPRVKEARFLTGNFKISSMIDISDGLFIDMCRIASASGKGFVIYENKVPLSSRAASFKKAVCEGEDFELLFTINKDDGRRLMKKAISLPGSRFTFIGDIVSAAKGFSVVNSRGRIMKLVKKGYLHF